MREPVTAYTFDPATRVLTLTGLSGDLNPDYLTSITNVTRNRVVHYPDDYHPESPFSGKGITLLKGRVWSGDKATDEFKFSYGAPPVDPYAPPALEYPEVVPGDIKGAGVTGVALFESKTPAAARTVMGAGTSSFDGSWSKLSGKPSTFPSATHTHTIANVTDLQPALDAKADTSALAGKANTSHTHTMANVTDLAAAMGKKADVTAMNARPALYSWNGTAKYVKPAAAQANTDLIFNTSTREIMTIPEALAVTFP